MLRRTAIAALLIAPQLIAQSATELTAEQKQHFLKTAKIVKMKRLSRGITGSIRATLSDGKITHDAHVQTIDVTSREFQGTRGTELNFRDSYKFNVAAYRLAVLLGLGDMVPVSVERKVYGDSAAVTWWVDDVMADEGKRRKQNMQPPDNESWSYQMYKVRVFDQLIYNTDRNLGNLLTTKDWRIHMIDHTRAFRLLPKIQTPANLVRCDKDLLERLRALDERTLMKTLMPYVRKIEIQALLQRRDQIVKFFEDEVQRKGEAAVLYSVH